VRQLPCSCDEVRRCGSEALSGAAVTGFPGVGGFQEVSRVEVSRGAVAILEVSRGLEEVLKRCCSLKRYWRVVLRYSDCGTLTEVLTEVL